MFCVECGQKLREKLKFCTACGTPKEAGEVASPTQSGISAVGNASFANDAQHIQPNEDGADKSPDKKGRAGIIVGTIALLVAALFALAYFVAYPLYQDWQTEQLNIAEAERVMDLIDSIDVANLTAGSLSKLDRINEEFNDLTTEQKDLVRNLSHLENALRIVEGLIADEEAAAEVVRAINAIDFFTLSIDDASCVAGVRSMYDALTPCQRNLVENWTDLMDLEGALERLIAEDEQRLRDEELARQEREREEREREEAEAARLQSAGLGTRPTGWLANTSSKSFTSPGYVITFYDTGRFSDTIRSGDYAFSYFNGRWEIYLAGYWYPFTWESRGGQEFSTIGVEDRRFTRR